jgi:ribonuclease HI
VSENLAHLPVWNETTGAHAANSQFCACINRAARRSIPRGDRRNPKPWWSPAVDEAIKFRNNAHRKAITVRSPDAIRDWNVAAAMARQAVIDAQRASIRAFTARLNMRTKPAEVWRTIKAHASSSAAASSESYEAIVVNGKTLTSDRAKANAFAAEYAAVSRLRRRRSDRHIKRAVNSSLRTQCGCVEADCSCSPFTDSELSTALSQMRDRTASGLDAISCEMLKELPPDGKARLLAVCNISWRSKVVPSSWKNGEIVPVHKPGKPLGQIGSFRPVALLSCVGKVMERLVKNRLTRDLEKKGYFSALQAGFRKGRCTEDQLLRVAQDVSDAFGRNDKRTVMVLIDFSRAFDKVWKYGLFNKMLEAGIPRCTVKWCKALLADRQCRVRINDCSGRFRVFREGVPQGAVLSPLLFLIFINDIMKDLPAGVKASLFADDAALWAHGRTVGEAEDKMQAALTLLEKWADKWRMTISTEKSESTVFTLDAAEARAEATLTLCGQPLKHNPNPKFLGVTFDRRLTFSAHVALTADKMTRRLQALKCMSGHDWGSCGSDLRALFTGFVQSVAEYGAAAWSPFISATSMSKLEVAQRAGARAISGCMKITPVNALLKEANLIPIADRLDQISCKAYVRAMSRRADDPLRAVASQPPGRRCSWRSKAIALYSDAGVAVTNLDQPLEASTVPPWTEPTNIVINPHLIRHISRNDPDDVKRAATAETLAALARADYELWTDGSVARGVGSGGSGIYLIANNFLDEEDEEISATASLSRPAGANCSSFRAEAVAIEAALRLLRDHLAAQAPGSAPVVRICTDSRSVVQRLLAGPAQQRQRLLDCIWSLLVDLATSYDATFTVQWIPSHCGIPGNERADVLADLGTRMDQSGISIDPSAVSNAVARHISSTWLANSRRPAGTSDPHWDSVGAKMPAMPDTLGLPRQMCTAVSRLRVGYSTLCNDYLHRINPERYLSDVCECGYEHDSVEHFLTCCGKHDALRCRVFGTPRPTRALVFSDVHQLAAFVRQSGRLPPPRV